MHLQKQSDTPQHPLLSLLVLCMVAACLISSGCAPTTRTRYPSVSGTITDFASGQPIANAAVIYENQESIMAVTDVRGRFNLPGKNFREIAWIGGEAPNLRADLRMLKSGYVLGAVEYNYTFGGGSPDKHLDVNIQMLPESHPLVPYVTALRVSLLKGNSAEETLTILRAMRQAGFTRKDARFIWEQLGWIFYYIKFLEYGAWSRLNDAVYYDDTVWPKESQTE